MAKKALAGIWVTLDKNEDNIWYLGFSGGQGELESFYSKTFFAYSESLLDKLAKWLIEKEYYNKKADARKDIKNLCIELKQEYEKEIHLQAQKVIEKIDDLKTTQPIKLDDYEKTIYEQFRNNPRKLEEVWKVLDELIVGEDDNKKVLFLTLLSATQDNPVGARIVGESSLGKTHLVRETLKLFPDSMKFILGGASEKVLLHRKPDKIENYTNIFYLKNKILWFLEEKGGEKSYDILRPILSRDQEEVVFEVTDKTTKTGKLFAKKIKFLGCPAFVTTSTRLEALQEMGTRVFSITPDFSKEQTQRIVERKLEKKLQLPIPPNTKHIQKYISELKPHKVWIPYAPLIKMTTNTTRARRDVDKILTLIESYCIFHQFEKPKIIIDGEPYIISSIADFNYVMGIVKAIILQTILNLPRSILDFYETLKIKVKDGLFSEVEGEGRDEKLITPIITHRKIAETLELAQSTARRYCNILEEAGLLYSSKEGREVNYFLPHHNDVKNPDVLFSVSNTEFEAYWQNHIWRFVISRIGSGVNENSLKSRIFADTQDFCNTSEAFSETALQSVNSVVFEGSLSRKVLLTQNNAEFEGFNFDLLEKIKNFLVKNPNSTKTDIINEFNWALEREVMECLKYLGEKGILVNL